MCSSFKSPRPRAPCTRVLLLSPAITTCRHIPHSMCFSYWAYANLWLMVPVRKVSCTLDVFGLIFLHELCCIFLEPAMVTLSCTLCALRTHVCFVLTSRARCRHCTRFSLLVLHSLWPCTIRHGEIYSRSYPIFLSQEIDFKYPCRASLTFHLHPMLLLLLYQFSHNCLERSALAVRWSVRLATAFDLSHAILNCLRRLPAARHHPLRHVAFWRKLIVKAIVHVSFFGV